MKLTRQDLLNLFCSCMLLLFLLAACGGQINQQKKATSTIPANASTESAGTKICSSTPPGSSEVMRSDKRIGGEWGFTLDETADGHALGILPRPLLPFEAVGW